MDLLLRGNSHQLFIKKESSVPFYFLFVTSDLEEKRRKRQEEWEKVRKPEDPVGTATCLY